MKAENNNYYVPNCSVVRVCHIYIVHVIYGFSICTGVANEDNFKVLATPNKTTTLLYFKTIYYFDI